MPISFACSCGKRLKVADNLVGKKVKCPGCQKITLVPAEDAAVGAPTSPPKASKPAAPAAKPGPAAKPAAGAGKDKTGMPAKSKPSAPPVAAKKPAPVDDEPDLSDLFGEDEEPA